MKHLDESVNGVILGHNRTTILLIKRRDVPVWVLPGGGIEKGETPEQAVLRELEEETGYRVAILRKVAEYTPICRLAKPTTLFECGIKAGKQTLSEETKDIRFFPLKALPKRLSPPYGDWIADTMAFSHQTLKKKITSVTYWNLIKHLVCHPLLVIRFLLTKIGIRFNSPFK